MEQNKRVTHIDFNKMRIINETYEYHGKNKRVKSIKGTSVYPINDVTLFMKFQNR